MRAEQPEAALILLSAGTAIRRGGSRELAWALARAVDWDKLVEMLAARRLLPQLGRRIVELSHGDAPERFASTVEAAITQTRRQGVLLELVATRLSSALAEQGIDAMTLKGSSLADAIYGDPGRRAAADVDLLVHQRNLADAVAIARRAGYGAPTDHVWRDGLPLLHLALAHERGELPPLELHWRVHWYERAFSSDMLSRASREPDGRLRATPVDELVSLLLFYARDGFLDLRLASDLAAWWDRHWMRLQSGALVEVIERYPALKRALVAAVTVAERVVGVPARRLLGDEHGQEARVRLAARLANPAAFGGRSQLHADVGLVDWLLAPRGGQWKFVRRQLLPPREVLDERSRVSAERSTSPLGHGVRVLGRYGLTLARLAAPSARRTRLHLTPGP